MENKAPFFDILDAPRWKMWALLGSSGLALALCAAAAISAPTKDKTLNHATLSVLGLVSGGLFLFASHRLEETDYPHQLLKVVQTKQMERAILRHLPIEDDDDDCVVDESGWSAPGDSALKLYDWENLPDENTGIMIAGGQGYGKTSVCVWLLGKLTETKPAIIEVLDPHGGINEIWRQNGLTTLSEYGEIESRLHGAISELDHRRQRAKNGDTNWDPYIFVCDEIDSCLENFGNSDVVGKAIRRLGKEGRKYDLSLIFITHTANASAKGIDAQERNCYVNILVGGSARNYAKYNYKKTDFEPTFLSSQAYPCIVVSGGEPFAAIHPTHGGYSQYKKKGNAPANLLPINQIQQGSVKVHEPAELSPAEPLNPLLSKEFGDFEPVNLQDMGWDMSGNLPTEYLGSMVQAIRSNMTKKDILEGMFLAKKGGNRYYQALSNIYEGLRGKV